MNYRAVDLEDRVLELQAENERLLAENLRLRHGHALGMLPFGSRCPRCRASRPSLRVFRAGSRFFKKPDRLDVVCNYWGGGCGAEWTERPADAEEP